MHRFHLTFSTPMQAPHLHAGQLAAARRVVQQSAQRGGRPAAAVCITTRPQPLLQTDDVPCSSQLPGMCLPAGSALLRPQLRGAGALRATGDGACRLRAVTLAWRWKERDGLQPRPCTEPDAGTRSKSFAEETRARRKCGRRASVAGASAPALLPGRFFCVLAAHPINSF